MILVIGATGTIGRHLVAELAAAGRPVRALTRSPEKARGLRGAEVAQGDLGDPASLHAALVDVERVFLLTNATPDQVELETRAIDAAKAAGVRHVVKLAALGTAPDAPVRYARSHAAIVEHLRASGLDATVLLPADFMDNLLASAPQIASQGTFSQAMAPETRVASTDPADVAAVAARALGGEHVGEDLALTGRALSRTELAEELSRALGREVTYVPIGEDDLRQVLLGAGLPAWNAEGLVELARVYASGAAGQETDTVQRVLGRPPRTWRDWLAQHADALRVAA